MVSMAIPAIIPQPPQYPTKDWRFPITIRYERLPTLLDESYVIQFDYWEDNPDRPGYPKQVIEHEGSWWKAIKFKTPGSDWTVINYTPSALKELTYLTRK